MSMLGRLGTLGAESFVASIEPIALPARLPLTFDEVCCAEPAADPAALTPPEIPFVTALAAPLAAPVADALVFETVSRVVVTRLPASSRTRRVVSRVRSSVSRPVRRNVSP
jgi:hypothetical protein